VAIAWLAARPGNIIPLLGATSVAQLDENLAAAGMHLDDHRRTNHRRSTHLRATTHSEIIHGHPR
jgi:aryl-alcohol dehydrogenase-like predicted oxidoreductase